MLLSQAWEMYDSDERIEGFSPKTLKAYQLQVTLLIRHLGDIEINSLTAEQLK
ncbi:integrase, partial [Domibacillus indicus]|uniref:integrase n=1 Tax=Domibacillus indicus TaxID=1437523 RepID=UPI000617BD9F